jgi:hypothetical protein
MSDIFVEHSLDAPQILSANATVEDARVAIERAFALIRAHGNLVPAPSTNTSSININWHGSVGIGSTVLGGSSSAVGTGCIVAGSGNALGTGCVVIGSGRASGIGSIQAPSNVSAEVQRLLFAFRTAVCNTALSRNLEQLKLA